MSGGLRFRYEISSVSLRDVSVVREILQNRRVKPFSPLSFTFVHYLAKILFRVSFFFDLIGLALFQGTALSLRVSVQKRRPNFLPFLPIILWRRLNL